MLNEQALTTNIPYRTLIDLHRNYLDDKHRILSAPMAKQDTKSIWFELNPTMRKFLEEILKDKNVSGIRMYLMQYPKSQMDMEGETIPTKLIDADQLTIGMVTTQKDGTSHRDYPTSFNKVEMLTAPPLNHGQLCPQIC